MLVVHQLGGAAMFRDDGLARDMPPGLYLGHIEVGEAGAELVHDEHAALRLPSGIYRARRQREYEPARFVSNAVDIVSGARTRAVRD